MDTTILGSSLNTVMKKEINRSKPPIVKELIRETTEEYAIATLNRLAKIKKKDVFSSEKGCSNQLIARGSLGKDCMADVISLRNTVYGPVISVLRSTCCSEKMTRKIDTRWTLTVTKNLPEAVKNAYEAAKVNLNRLGKF